MNGRLILLSSNKIKHYIKESIVFTKTWCFKQNFLTIIVLPSRTRVPREKIKAINTPKEQLFGEISCSESHPWKCKCLQFFFNYLKPMRYHNQYLWYLLSTNPDLQKHGKSERMRDCHCSFIIEERPFING